MITNLLLTVISLGTWRGAGHSKHTAQGVAEHARNKKAEAATTAPAYALNAPRYLWAGMLT